MIPSTADIERVQSRLIELGYVEVDQVDGTLEGKTKDAILAFRRRNGIPLVDDNTGEPLFIDDELIMAMEKADKKELPIRQTTATVEQIAPKVEAVAAAVAAAETTASTAKKTWWANFTARVAALPSAAVTFFMLVVGQFDVVAPIIVQVRSLFAEVPWQIWAIGFIAICVLYAIHAQIAARAADEAKRLADKAQEKLVQNYQEGTLKNDPKVTS